MSLYNKKLKLTEHIVLISDLFVSSTVSYGKLRQVEKIDKAFQYVLLLIGVLTAALFELSAYLESVGLAPKQSPFFLSRAFFSPLVLLVLMWFCSAFLKKTTTRIWLRLTSWSFGIILLRTIIVAFVNWNFLIDPLSSLGAFLLFNIFSLVSTLLMCVALYFVLKSYMVPLRSIPYFGSRRWALIISTSWAFCGGAIYGFVLISYVSLNVFPLLTVFTGLLPILIGVFILTFFFFSLLGKNRDVVTT